MKSTSNCWKELKTANAKLKKNLNNGGFKALFLISFRFLFIYFARPVHPMRIEVSSLTLNATPSNTKP